MLDKAETTVNQLRAQRLLSNKYTWAYIVKDLDFIGQVLKRVYA